MNLERPVAPDPYELLPRVPEFTLESDDMSDGQRMPEELLGFGANESPHLRWSGFPAETQSFIVTCFDPDAPTPSGYWHWIVTDVPLETTELEHDAGRSDLFLPGPASHVRNDAGVYAYYGAAPPKGDHAHRYMFVVHALDVDSLELDPEDVTAGALAFATGAHTLARAILTVTYQR